MVSHVRLLINHVSHHPDQYDLIPRTSVPLLLLLAAVSKAANAANKDKNKRQNLKM